MSNDLYQVLARNLRGREFLTDPEPHEAAEATARRLDSEGYAVGSIMTVASARAYMEHRYAPTYRGVKIPDELRADGAPYDGYETWKRDVDARLDGAEQPAPASEDPFAPDLTMSREAADFILRAFTSLLDDGSRPMAYTGYGPDDADEQDYDAALMRRAADIVGRDKIKDSELLRYLAELDAETEGDR